MCVLVYLSIIIFVSLVKNKQSDAYQGTGCYNLLCSGFVQVNREIAMGGSISPLSGYGNSQYDITILIWKINQQQETFKTLKA